MVVESLEMTKNKIVIHNAFGEICAIGCLLASETVCPELSMINSGDTMRCNAAGRSFEPRVGRAGGCE